MATKGKAKPAPAAKPTGTRKKPVTPFWSHTMIREAKLFKEFTGKVDKNIFSSIDSVRGNARLHSTRADWSQIKLPQGKVNFTLGARAHDKQGRLIWG